MRKKTNTKLDRSERALERRADAYRPVSEAKRRRIEAVLAGARKTRSINLRIAEETLAELRLRSAREGMPYQTLIASILHKYVTGRLVDESAVAKAVHLLRSRRSMPAG